MQDYHHNFSSVSEFDTLAETVAERLRCEFVFVNIVDGDAMLSLGHSHPTGAPDERAARKEDTICSRTVAAGRILRLPDIRRDPELNALPAVKKCGAAAYLGAPVWREDKGIVGAICAISTSPRIWRDSEAEYLALAAELVESKIDRQMLHLEKRALSKALAENDAVLVALSGLAGKAFTVHNAQGELVFASGGMATDLGLEHNALKSLPELAQSVADAGQTEADATVDQAARPAAALRVNVSRASDGLTLADWSLAERC